MCVSEEHFDDVVFPNFCFCIQCGDVLLVCLLFLLMRSLGVACGCCVWLAAVCGCCVKIDDLHALSLAS